MSEPAKRLSFPEFVAVIAMLFATIAFSIDAMLPALPEIAQELSPDAPNRAQLILTAFVLGMGLGTFIAGPVSDTFGRKPVILVASVLYCAAALVAIGAPGAMVLIPLLLGRVMDGLDGAVARATQKTDFGGFLDIVSDFVFYGAIPLAFVLRDPAENGVAGAFLLFTFYVNGASFLAYATMAAKRGLETTERGEKSLYFTAGLMEGTETILFFVLICLFPVLFPFLSLLFGLLCLVTAGARVWLAWRTLDLD